MEPIWRIEMFGTLKASQEDDSLTRFRTRRVALLLAFLSYFRSQEHFRDDLGEMLWPEQEEEVVRRNLRQALFSLRQTLEPPPLPAGSILQVRQARVYLDPARVTTDVSDFEALIERARKAKSPSEEAALYQEAICLYRGELLPGLHDEWILRERLKMEDLYVSCLRKLIAFSKLEGRHDDTIIYLRKALTQEPLQEEWHTDLMDQYLKAGRPSSALKQYRELESLLAEQLGCTPSAGSKSLAHLAERAATISKVPPQVRSIEKHSLKRTAARPLSESRLEDHVPAVKVLRLPVQVTRFYGRREEIERVCHEFRTEQVRLISLLGPAGTGKTRLAIEIARELAERDGWNVWFAPLADLPDASMVLDAVVDLLKARKAEIPDLVDQIAATVKGDDNLLVLDNLEHILEDVVSCIAELVERVPNLRILVTSRQSLCLGCEREFPVDPLPVPIIRPDLDSDSREELAVLAEVPSIQLFLDRSQAIRPDVQLTASNARTIAAICAKLEGIPLAIELAAGQTSTIAPSQMLRHLERRLTALSTRRRDATPRHRSLKAAIDYSYDSLPPNLQRFFTTLSVFRGGFTVESALEVSLEGLNRTGFAIEQRDRNDPQKTCLELIEDLRERSLVRPDHVIDVPDPRFRMLESFRQYGEERLSPVELESLKTRHAEFFLNRFTTLPEHASAEEHTQLHLSIEAEHDNFIAALEFLFETKAYDACIRLLTVLSTTWLSRGPRIIEREYIRQLVVLTQQSTVEPRLQIRLLRMMGTTHIRASEYLAAHRAMESAVQIALQLGDDELIATCYSGLSVCSGFLGWMKECLELNQEALKRVSPANYPLLARIHLGIGAVYWSEADLPEAEVAFLLAKEASERAHGGEPDPLILLNLARVSLDLGRGDEALSIAGDAIRICQRLREPYGLSQSLYLVARYHWLRGDMPAAIATNQEALALGRDTAFGFLSLYGIRNHALILAKSENWAVATTLFAASQSISKMQRTIDERDFSLAQQLCSDQLSREEYERAWARGLAMGGDEALRLAMGFK